MCKDRITINNPPYPEGDLTLKYKGNVFVADKLDDSQWEVKFWLSNSVKGTFVTPERYAHTALCQICFRMVEGL